MSRRYWYLYTGASGDEALVGNYSRIAGDFNCSGGPTLCVIYALGNDNPYAITSTLLSYITSAKNTFTYRPSGVGQKTYVYTRDI